MLLAAACVSAPATDAPKADVAIQSLRWLPDDGDAVGFLTTRPVACRDKPPAGQETRIELGRVAFESPALVGGLAARIGLACGSCHINGRGNSDFFIVTLSDKAGNADVTSSQFSKTRGDGKFDPKPIPDIATRAPNQIKDRKSAAFHDKLHGLIVEEFDGLEPPAPVFDAVRDYLDGLDIAACADPGAREARDAMQDVSAAKLAATADFSTWPDPAVVEGFYLRVSRNRLERVHERFAAPELKPVRDKLIAISREMEARGNALRDHTAPPPRVSDAEWAALKALIRQDEAKSLYNADVLRAALKR